MYLLFADESGTPPTPEKAAGRYLIIGGVIIPEGSWHGVAKDFKKLLTTFRVRGEVKWKYFATGNDKPENPMAHLSREQRQSFRTQLFQLITSRKAIKIICCVCSVEAAYRRPTINSQDAVYHLTYKGMSERFQYFLQDATRITGQQQYGLVICDHRMTNDDRKLRARHHDLIDGSGQFTSNYANFVETIFFSPSDASVGLQLADLVAGAVHRSFQHGEHRFADQIKTSFRQSPSGAIPGYGLVKMPRDTFVIPPRGDFLSPIAEE